MKVIAITEPGASPALIDLPAPSPAEGEVLVRVRGSSVNGFDLSVAHGKLIGMTEHRYPVVLGKDFAGTAVPDVTAQVPVQRTYHLANAPQAFSGFAAGTLGKLAVSIN